MHVQALISTSLPPADFVYSSFHFVYGHSSRLLSVDGFDRVLFNEALQRLYVEPQRPPHLDRRKLSEPSLLVDGVHLQAQVSGDFLRIQEPLTDSTIRLHPGSTCRPARHQTPIISPVFKTACDSRKRKEFGKSLGDKPA